MESQNPNVVTDIMHAIAYTQDVDVRIIKKMDPLLLFPTSRNHNYEDITDRGDYSNIEFFDVKDMEEECARLRIEFYEPVSSLGRPIVGYDGSEILMLGRITLLHSHGSYGGVAYFICESHPGEDQMRIVYHPRAKQVKLIHNCLDNEEFVLGSFPIDKTIRKEIDGKYQSALMRSIVGYVKMWDVHDSGRGVYADSD